MKKVLAVIMTLIIAVSFCACGNSGNKGGAVTFTDQMGNEVTLEKTPEKVVVLTPACAEVLYALGCGDKVVGRGEYCDYPEEVLNVTMVKSGAEANIEEIVALEPDLLIYDSMGMTEDQLKAFKDAGLQVLVTNADTFETTYEMIALIGKAMGKDAEAEAIVAEMKKTFEDVAEKAKGFDLAGKKVYFEVSPLQWGLWTAGADTFMDELCNVCGIENAFADVSGWAQISEEQVIERNPDYIVTITMYYGEGPRPEEEIASRAGWENITAVKEGKILCIDSNIVSRPAPRLMEAAQTLLDFFTAE